MLPPSSFRPQGLLFPWILLPALMASCSTTPEDPTSAQVPGGLTDAQCTDEPPDDRYTCTEQVGWHDCETTEWLKDRCNFSCGRCSRTSNSLPEGPMVNSPTPSRPSSKSSDTSESVQGPRREGMATQFEHLGQPAGGCGIPEDLLETGNFVALNVQHTPNDYTTGFSRPIGGANAAHIGEFDNGRNCGRWVRVTLGDRCTGSNDGAPNRPFCANGQWISDDKNGATLDMIVADSCQDGNAWCRDDRFHLDLAKGSLSEFQKGGKSVGDLTGTWDNRKVSWHFIEAPAYEGDVRIGFRFDATRDWPAIVLTHLRNGVHRVERLVDGSWKAASNVSDNGQVFVLPSGPEPYVLRITDADDKLVNNGKTYRFSFPPTCGQRCSAPFNEVQYQTE